MADNITAPAIGAVLATDDILGVHHPFTKVEFGVDGVATPVTAATPLPVTFAGSGFELGATSLAALISCFFLSTIVSSIF